MEVYERARRGGRRMNVPTPISDFVGRAVQEKRQASGMTVADLAQASDQHPQTIRLIERGGNRVTVDVLFLLASGLGCDPSDLLPPA